MDLVVGWIFKKCKVPGSSYRSPSEFPQQIGGSGGLLRKSEGKRGASLEGRSEGAKEPPFSAFTHTPGSH